MPKPAPELITRHEAFAIGRTHYFTGKPCKQGHIALRYVSTGGCKDCQSPFKLRRHPFRKDLQPYICPKLWVPANATPEQYKLLEVYLQTCIDTFFEYQNAPASVEPTV